MRTKFAVLAVAGLLLAGVAGERVFATGADEAEAVQILRIEMRKSLMGQEALPKVTAARVAKLKYLQSAKDGTSAKDVSDAEVDVIEAQAAEQTANLQAKVIEAQLNDAVKNAASIPARQAASATEIAVLQLEVAKAKLAVDAASKVAANRKQVVSQLQSTKADAGKMADATADAESAQANVGLLGLEAEEAQVRLDSAVKSTKAK